MHGERQPKKSWSGYSLGLRGVNWCCDGRGKKCESSLSSQRRAESSLTRPHLLSRQGPSPDENKIRNIVAHAINERRQKASQGGVTLPLISIPVLSIVRASNAPAAPPTPIVIDLTEDSPEPELTAPVVTSLPAEPSQSNAGPARPQAHSASPSIVLPPSVRVRVANPLQDSASSASSRIESPSSNAPPVVYGSSQAPNAEPIAATAPPLLAPTAITTRNTPSPAPPKSLLSPIRPPSAPVATAETAPPPTTGRRERAVSVNAANLSLATARLHAASQAGLAHTAPAPALTVGQVVQAIPRRTSQGSTSRPQDLHRPRNSSNGGLPGPPPPRAADANYTSTLPAPIPQRPHSAPSQQPHSQPPARLATPPIAEAEQYLIGHSVVPSAMSESFFDWLPKHGLERSQGFIRSWGYELGISTREMETILHFLMGYAAMDRPTGEEVARRRRVAVAHLHETGRRRTVEAQWHAQQQQHQQHHHHPVQQVYPLPTAGQDRRNSTSDATFVIPPPHRRASDGHQHPGTRFIESNPQSHDPSHPTRPKTSDGQQQQFGPCASPVSADLSPPQPHAAQLPPPQHDAFPPPPSAPPALLAALSNNERALLWRAFEIGAEQSGELKGGVEVLKKRWEERMQTIRELGEMEKPRAAQEEAPSEETNDDAATKW